MPDFTTKLNLELPSQDDNYDISVFNQNSTKIDSAFSIIDREFKSLDTSNLTDKDNIFMKKGLFSGDLDQLLHIGSYVIDTGITGTLPNGVTAESIIYSILNVFGNEQYLMQEIITTNISLGVENKKYRRTYFNGGWSSWTVNETFGGGDFFAKTTKCISLRRSQSVSFNNENGGLFALTGYSSSTGNESMSCDLNVDGNTGLYLRAYNGYRSFTSPAPISFKKSIRITVNYCDNLEGIVYLY